MSGSELAKAKEAAAEKMRQKQAAGMRQPVPDPGPYSAAPEPKLIQILSLADQKKTAEAGGAKK